VLDIGAGVTGVDWPAYEAAPAGAAGLAFGPSAAG
jgi:hypothetical protein